MLYSLLAVMVGVTVLMLARRYVRWMTRRAGRSRLRGAPVLLEATDVRIGALVQDARAFPRLNPKKRTRLVGDLYLTGERLLLVSHRGVLLDLPHGDTKHLSDARSSGPGRLVLEGRAPGRPEGQGLFRFELSLDEPRAWVEALRPYCRSRAGR